MLLGAAAKKIGTAEVVETKYEKDTFLSRTLRRQLEDDLVQFE